MPLLDTLRSFPVFAHVPDDQLQWFIDRATEQTYPADYVLTKPGDPIDNLLVLLDGQVTIDNGQNGADDDLATYGPAGILGALPFSRLRESRNRVVADKPTHVLELHRDHFRDLAHECYELTEVFVQQMTTRVRDFTRQAQQNEKMASLGRLSAGLAHELNNPVAAVVRSAATLKEHLRATPDSFKGLMKLSLTDAQVDAVNKAFFEKIDRQAAPLSLLEKSSREDELTDWLDDRAVPDALDLAGSLTEFGVTPDDLDWLLGQIGDDNLPGVLDWLVDNMVTERLVRDIADASHRIQALVGSIKNYTHMDRGAGKEPVHLPDGIRSTLTLLDHKLRAKRIDVVLDLPDTLPAVCGWPGELNQVWTNLIDNAIDALPNGGQINIRSVVDRNEFVLTTVTDNGSGIPADLKDKIFEPFFTTKEIGKGTGLGLDIVLGIVKHHNGSVKVESKPGQTEFSVCLPLR